MCSVDCSLFQKYRLYELLFTTPREELLTGIEVRQLVTRACFCVCVSVYLHISNILNMLSFPSEDDWGVHMWGCSDSIGGRYPYYCIFPVMGPTCCPRGWRGDNDGGVIMAVTCYYIIVHRGALFHIQFHITWQVFYSLFWTCAQEDRAVLKAWLVIRG